MIKIRNNNLINGWQKVIIKKEELIVNEFTRKLLNGEQSDELE